MDKARSDRRNKRRLLLAALGSSALPLVAFAQAPGDVRRIGVLSPISANDATTRTQYGFFVDRLRELGYVEGKNLAIEWRFADGQFDRLNQIAGALVKTGVEVIVTNGSPATSAAKRATATVPIVAASFGDPVASGFARSLAKPGGNITGFSVMGSVVLEKRLDLLLEALPEAKRIGLLVHADNEFFVRVLPGVQAAAQSKGREVSFFNARDPKTLQEAFSNMASRKVGGVLVSDETFLNSQTGVIAGLALKYKLPAAFAVVRGAEDGGLLAYANDPKYRYQMTASYVDKILKGAKPAEMPIEQPIKFTLVVNKKTAATLGIAIPPALLVRADRVIE